VEKNSERGYKSASSLHLFSAVYPFPNKVALALCQSGHFTHTLCLGLFLVNCQVAGSWGVLAGPHTVGIPRECYEPWPQIMRKLIVINHH